MGGGGGGGPRGVVGQVALDDAREAVEGNVANGADHHAVRRVVALDEAEQLLAGEVLDGFLVTEDVAADGVVGVDEFLEVVEDELAGVVLVGVDFVEDDVLFLLDFLVGEGGVEDDIGE